MSGFLAPLAAVPLENMDALLLGAGGAAHAVAAGLRLRRCRKAFVATPSNRSHLSLAERFGFTPVLWEQRHDVPADLIINTTPLGMRGKYEKESPYDFSLAAPGHVASATDTATGSPYGGDGGAGLAYDIVYNPLETRFLREARRPGGVASRAWKCSSARATPSSGSGPAGPCPPPPGRFWKPPCTVYSQGTRIKYLPWSIAVIKFIQAINSTYRQYWAKPPLLRRSAAAADAGARGESGGK